MLYYVLVKYVKDVPVELSRSLDKDELEHELNNRWDKWDCEVVEAVG